jgi:hypothetical protein
MRETLERSQTASKRLRAVLRESLRRSVAPAYLRTAAERRMYELLLKGRSEFASAARQLRQKYGGVPSRKKTKKQQQQQRQQHQQHGEAAAVAAGAPREVLQKWRRGSDVERWLYVLAKELSRRRGVLGSVDNAPDPSWVKLRRAWKDIEANWDSLGSEAVHEGMEGAEIDVGSADGSFNDMTNRSTGGDEKPAQQSPVPDHHPPAPQPEYNDSSTTDDPPQERVAALGPATGYAAKAAQAYRRAFEVGLLNMKLRANVDRGMVRTHLAEQMRQAGQTVAHIARNKVLENYGPRFDKSRGMSGRWVKVHRTISFRP